MDTKRERCQRKIRLQKSEMLAKILVLVVGLCLQSCASICEYADSSLSLCFIKAARQSRLTLLFILLRVIITVNFHLVACNQIIYGYVLAIFQPIMFIVRNPFERQ